MKVKKFYEPILKVTVYFITDSIPSEVKNFINKRSDKRASNDFDMLEGSITLLDKTDSRGRKFRDYLINVEDKNDFYVLLHESVHLVGWILEDRNISVKKENDEIFAYYQEYWFKTLWRFMNKK